MRVLPLFFVTVVAVATSMPCAAQSVISAKSGTLHYFTHQVSIDGVDQRMRPGIFPVVKQGSILRTESGRAEVLLTPGVFLRLVDNSAIRMLDTDLAHTRVEVVSGDVMVEADDPGMSVKNAPVTLVFDGTEIRIVKHGLIEISRTSNQVKVYRGEAEVTTGTATLWLKEGRYSALSGDLKAERFDVRKDSSDSLAWSQERSANLSAANIHAAGTMRAGPGYGYSGAPWDGGWYYNSMFGYFTYIPLRGTTWNPWGYGFYSPGTIFGSDGISPGWFRSVVVTDNNTLGRNGAGGIRPPGTIRPPDDGGHTRGAFAAAATGVAEGRRSPSGGYNAGGFNAGTINRDAGGSGSFSGGRAASADSFGGARNSGSGGGGGGGIANHSGGGNSAGGHSGSDRGRQQ